MTTLIHDDTDDFENVVPFNVSRLVRDACATGSFEAAERAALERRRDVSWRQFLEAACDLADACEKGREVARRLGSLAYWHAAWRRAVTELDRLDADRPSDTEGE